MVVVGSTPAPSDELIREQIGKWQEAAAARPASNEGASRQQHFPAPFPRKWSRSVKAVKRGTFSQPLGGVRHRPRSRVRQASTFARRLRKVLPSSSPATAEWPNRVELVKSFGSQGHTARPESAANLSRRSRSFTREGRTWLFADLASRAIRFAPQPNRMRGVAQYCPAVRRRRERPRRMTS